MRTALFFLPVALLMPATTLAQGDPFATRPQDDRHDGYRGRPAVYAGEFVLVPHGDDMLLVDSKSGCIWRRRPSTQYDQGSWRFEFPEFAGIECNKRLEQARAKSLKEGAN